MKIRSKSRMDGPVPPDLAEPDHPPTHAAELIALARNGELFHAPDGRAYATVRVRAHNETWAIRSKGFRQWAVQHFYRVHRKPPCAQALADALGVLEAEAKFSGPEHSVFLRVAEADGAIYLDLANGRWKAVEITARGWRVVSNPPVKFRRSSGMAALPNPRRGGSLRELDAIVNIKKSDRVLLRAWLAAAMRPRGPYPPLVLHGEQGSTKSTLAKVVGGLIDPRTPALRSQPRREQDLMIAASNVWCVNYDNLSYLPAWFSDALCRLAIEIVDLRDSNWLRPPRVEGYRHPVSKWCAAAPT